MLIALVVRTVLLAVLALNFAAMKVRKDEQVLASITGTVGVPERHLPVLAGLEVAGAVGIPWACGSSRSASPLRSAWSPTSSALSSATSGPARRRRSTPVVPLRLSVSVLAIRLLTV